MALNAADGRQPYIIGNRVLDSRGTAHRSAPRAVQMLFFQCIKGGYCAGQIGGVVPV